MAGRGRFTCFCGGPEVFFQTPQARFHVALHLGIFLGKNIGNFFPRIFVLTLIGIRNAVIFKGDLARRLVLSGE
jgi:hypothetical protein